MLIRQRKIVLFCIISLLHGVTMFASYLDEDPVITPDVLRKRTAINDSRIGKEVRQKLNMNRALDANPQYDINAYSNRSASHTLDTSYTLQKNARSQGDSDPQVPKDGETLNFDGNGLENADHAVELVFPKMAVPAYLNGPKRDVKIIIKQGNFPYGTQGPVADIIINDAMPDLMGGPNQNGSLTDQKVFSMLDTDRLARLAIIKIAPSLNISRDLKRKIQACIDNGDLTFIEESFQFAPEIPNDLKKKIEILMNDDSIFVERIPVINDILHSNHPLIEQFAKIKAHIGKNGLLAYGTAVATKFMYKNMPYYVVHAVVPHDSTRKELLQEMIRNVLKQARKIQDECTERHIETIAFPSLATHFGYSIDEVATTIIQEIGAEIQKNNFSITQIRFVLDSEEEFITYRNALSRYTCNKNNMTFNKMIEICNVQTASKDPVVERIVVKSSHGKKSTTFASEPIIHVIPHNTQDSSIPKVTFPEPIKSVTFWQKAQAFMSSPLTSIRSTWESWGNSGNKKQAQSHQTVDSFFRRHLSTMIGGSMAALSLFGIAKLLN